MSSPNRCGISFSSFSSFIDSSGSCLEAIYDGTSRVVEGVAGDVSQSADAFSYASSNYSMERGPSGFVSDYLAVRRFQEMSEEFGPIARGLAVRLTEVRAAGVGPLRSLENGAAMCSSSEPEIDCSLMSDPECPEETPRILFHADVIERIQQIYGEESGGLLTELGAIDDAEERETRIEELMNPAPHRETEPLRPRSPEELEALGAGAPPVGAWIETIEEVRLPELSEDELERLNRTHPELAAEYRRIRSEASRAEVEAPTVE